MKSGVSIALGAMLLGSPAIAADKPIETVVIATAASSKPTPTPKKVCRMIAQTGTMIRRRTCLTQDEMAMSHDHAQDYLRRTRDDITGTNRGLQDR